MTISHNADPFCNICKGAGKVQAPTAGEISRLVSCPSCVLMAAPVVRAPVTNAACVVCMGRGVVYESQAGEFEARATWCRACIDRYKVPIADYKPFPSAYLYKIPGGGESVMPPDAVRHFHRAGMAAGVLQMLVTLKEAYHMVNLAMDYRGDDFERVQFELEYQFAECMYWCKEKQKYVPMGFTQYARDVTDHANQSLAVWLRCAKRRSMAVIGHKEG